MNRYWLAWLNTGLAVVALGFCVAIALLWLHSTPLVNNSNERREGISLPANAFRLPAEKYNKTGGPLLALAEAPPELQVPDLRTQLVYQGKNGRPDAQSANTFLHFAFVNNKNSVSIKPNEPLYIAYERSSSPARYVFSSDNKPTSLWIEANVFGNEAVIQVTMLSHNGQKITHPQCNSCFRLPEKDTGRVTFWELGTLRFDSTILARQRARWYGMDRFLETHGGDEYRHVIGKQRLDFGENETLYSVFVKLGDALMWKDDRWQAVSDNQESLRYPLLVLKKVDERLMSFELWDVEGKGKIILNLLKSSDPWTMRNSQIIQQMFKFVGARTHTKFVFDISGERIVLSPSDWLLLTAKGWKKLSNTEDIDAYVNGKLTGTLFVFEAIGRKGERQVIQGRLYSPTRNDFEAIEIPLQPVGIKSSSEGDAGKNKDEEDDDEIPLKNIKTA